MKKRSKTYRKVNGRSKKRGQRQKQNPFTAPRTAEQFHGLPRKLQDLWNRVVQVSSEMRAHGLSLTQASRQFGVNRETVLHLAPSAFTKKSGRYQVKSTDRLLRVVLIPGKKGLREVALRDSSEASLVGQYWSAVDKALGPKQDTNALRKLRSKTVTDDQGKRVRLLTNLEQLQRQASAGVLHFESLYGRRA